MNFYGRSVLVTGDNIDKALRKFKKKIQSSGLLQELRDRETYQKPTTRRKTKRSQAKQRWKKYVSSQKLPTRMY
jgi:small subunit ribosomal protein S21